MARNTTALAQRIERAIHDEITRRLGSISNPVLRASIEELLADSVQEKILAAVSAVPPRAVDIATAVQHSLDELAKDMKNLKSSGGALKGSFRSADSGSKSGSGGKSSPRRAPPSPRRDSGGKYGHGGK